MANGSVPAETTVGPNTALEVLLLGTVEFAEIDYLQWQLIRRVKLSPTPLAYLVLVEHPPIITVGRSGSRSHIRLDDAQLHAMGVPIRWVSRGGGAIVHGPGQLTAYAVLSLKHYGLHLRAYLDGLRSVLLTTLADFDIVAEVFRCEEGIWANTRRIGQVAVGVSNWVTSFGMTLEVETPVAWSKLLKRRGPFKGKAINMAVARHRRLEMPAVREALIERFRQQFAFDGLHLYTSHPLATRQARRPAYAVSVD